MQIREGLTRGRIQQLGEGTKPSRWVPSFAAALDAATVEDLQWALDLMIRRPHTKYRTYRHRRMRLIAQALQARLQE